MIAGGQIGAKQTGDSFARRDIHLVQGELDALAGVGLVRCSCSRGTTALSQRRF